MKQKGRFDEAALFVFGHDIISSLRRVESFDVGAGFLSRRFDLAVALRLAFAGLIDERQQHLLDERLREVRQFIDAHVGVTVIGRGGLAWKVPSNLIPDRQQQTEVAVALGAPVDVVQVMDAADRQMAIKRPKLADRRSNAARSA